MVPDYPYIKYDIPAIIAYQKDLQSTIEFIKDELPDVNWNSQIETKDWFKSAYELKLDFVTIHCLQYELEALKNRIEYHGKTTINDNVMYQELAGLIELKKLQSIVRNYTSNIIKHADKNGIYPLRLVNGDWVQQNKRPISYLKEIQECIIEMRIPSGAETGTNEAVKQREMEI